MNKRIAGVILVGGKSSRMGQNKALLNYNGMPLILHMKKKLESLEINSIYMSGNLKGYDCIKDKQPHQGPANAMHELLNKLSNYDAVLFIPVDMPLLNPEALRYIMNDHRSRYIDDSPLPAFITKPFPSKSASSVKEYLKLANAISTKVPLTINNSMINTNTPEEWNKVIQG